jgi:1-acyl-sn-glycerol-3-phosphate acyltransferase
MIFALLYVPIALLSYHFYGVKCASLSLFAFGFLTLFWFLFKHNEPIKYLQPLLIVVIGLVGFFVPNIIVIKSYPFIISSIFFTFFLYSILSGKYLLIDIITKLKKRKLATQERVDIEKSHWIWVVTLGINCAIHLYLLFGDDLRLWAIYSFVGWYILFGFTIALQVLFVHRRELPQWLRNLWGYGLFCLTIAVLFIPEMILYFIFVAFYVNKPHIVFQKCVTYSFKLFFRYAPSTRNIILDKSPLIMPHTAYIYAPSHESWLDYPLIGAFVTDLYHLTNKNRAFSWYLRPIAKLLGVLDGVGNNSLHPLLQKLRENSNVLIFPEGSRSSDGELGAFKYGTFALSLKSGVSIVPVNIYGTHRLVAKGSMNWGWNRGVDIIVEMLDPISPLDGESKEALATRVRDIMIAKRKLKTL